MIYWKTITTYLVDGSPTWVKTVELSNWIWKAIIIPRAKLKDVKNRPEVLQPAIYFLFWENSIWEKIAYIWEAENLINRIWSHDVNKNFWDIVIAFVSKDNNLTKADVKYLEAKAIKKAKSLNRYFLQNEVIPISNNLPEYQVATMNEFLDNIDLLISAIWYPIIKDVNTWNDQKVREGVYRCTWSESKAMWMYNEEWFLVFKNSIMRKKLSKSSTERLLSLQKALIDDQVITSIDGGQFIFLQDYLFSSPSLAASIVLWRSANWWTEWKDEEWKTLDEVERRKLR